MTHQGRRAAPRIRVIATGPLTTVQDFGRTRLAHLAVGRSGAADRDGLALANRLVGNPPGHPAFEVTAGGLVVAADAAVRVAVGGAVGEVLVDGRAVGSQRAVTVAAGERVSIGRPVRGLRSYLAISGGLTVPHLLGSASQDTLAGVVPAPVVVGAVLDTGHPGPVPAPGPISPLWRGEAELTLAPGPRSDWLSTSGAHRLTASLWEVASTSDRTAVRLDGPAIDWDESRRGHELASEGIRPGAVQIPPSGRPVIFLADHPTTGGYPVVGVVTEASLAVLGQLRPGETVRLRRAR